MRNSRIQPYAINQSPLFKISSQRRLADLLNITLSELRHLANANDLYVERDEPKSKGGVRRIENPHRVLKRVQARIAKLLSRIAPPSFLFCPVKRRSYVDNAKKHLGNPIIRTLDIKEYFQSTPKRLAIHQF